MRFKIPILAFLIFFLSKEVFSYDGEKVVILCILSFIILAYYNTKDALYNTFLARTERLKDEYAQLAEEKARLEKEIRRFWRIFLDLEDQLIEIFLWVKYNITNSINKFNKNRHLLITYLVKDQLNLLVKEKLKIDQHLNELVLKNTLTNFRNLISNNYDYRLNYINDLNFYLDRLTAIEPSHNLLDLALNKLRINKEFFCDKTQKWVDFNNFMLMNTSLRSTQLPN